MSEYNPIQVDGNIAVNATYQEVTTKDCEFIRLYPVSGNATIYINNVDNLPPILLYEAMELDNKDDQIEKLIFHSDTSTITNIKLVTFPPGNIVRAGFEG